jgi:type IV pilus assembly protein PilE
MEHKLTHRTSRRGGFTLIELMITVAIVSLLAMVALPGFMGQIRKSRRTEARTALLDMAARAERMYSTTNSYLDGTNKLTPADLGYPAAATWPLSVGSGYYTIDIKPNAPTATTFNFQAVPVGGQAVDAQCASFTVDNTGNQSALDASTPANNTTQICWK